MSGTDRSPRALSGGRIVVALVVCMLLSAAGGVPRAQQTIDRVVPPRLPASVVLAPTIHPPVSLELSTVWLAPSDADRMARARSDALDGFTTGEQLLADGKYEQALRVLSAPALADTPLAEYAAYYTALAELKLLRFEDARRHFAALRARKPKGYLSEAALLGEAEAAESQKDYQAALRVYDQLQRQKPLAPDEVWLRVAKAALASGDRARAAEAYLHVYYEFPQSDLAAEAESAVLTMAEIEPIRPSNARYRFELGRAERMFGFKRYSDARDSFERLRPHASGDDKELVALRLAECDYYMRRYRVAREALRPYLEGSARQAEAQFFFLMATRGLNERAEFALLAHQLVIRFPESSWAEEALNNLATAYIQQDRDDETDAVLRELYRMFPNGHYAERAAWKIGWRAYLTAHHTEAAGLFEKTAAAFPRSDYRPAFLYWAGRARDAIGDPASARARYELVTADYLNSYYGRLAARALEARGERAASSAFVSSDLISWSGSSAGQDGPDLPQTRDLIRLLLALGLYDDALNELQYAQNTWGDSPTLQATIAWIAYQQGEQASGTRRFTLFRRAINSMKRAYPQYLAAGGENLPRDLLTVIFPLGYWDLIRKYAAASRLDPYMVAALIAQESTFVPDIRSPANAVGLMQFIPATGRRYARALKLPYSASILTNPETSIRMGTAYLSDLMKQFGESHLALASYNAGEGRVRKWMAERPGMDRDEFIDDIPFPETQNYVKKILGTADDYRRLYAAGMDPATGMSAAPAARKAAPPTRTLKKAPPAKAPARGKPAATPIDKAPARDQ